MCVCVCVCVCVFVRVAFIYFAFPSFETRSLPEESEGILYFDLINYADEEAWSNIASYVSLYSPLLDPCKTSLPISNYDPMPYSDSNETNLLMLIIIYISKLTRMISTVL